MRSITKLREEFGVGLRLGVMVYPGRFDGRSFRRLVSWGFCQVGVEIEVMEHMIVHHVERVRPLRF